MRWGWALLVAGALLNASAVAEPAYGPELQGFSYAFPVHGYTFTSQRQTLTMAYLDVAPVGPPTGTGSGQTVVLLHGKNFCAGTWEGTINALSEAGYRVVAPDQIGFCKSSKPGAYQFSFQQLALNTRNLLRSLGIEHAIMLGHSTGGMLAMRYSLMFPAAVDRLVLVDPIGLEDWAAKGVPYIGVDAWFARELKTNAESIRRYEQQTYYAGEWKPEYQRWVDMLAGMYAGPGKNDVAWDSALLYDMIVTEPVVYEMSAIQPRTLLIVGDKDNTAIGKDLAPEAVRATLGSYPTLAKQAAAAIPHATLVEFPALGHAPQLSDPAAFHSAVLGWLAQ